MHILTPGILIFITAMFAIGCVDADPCDLPEDYAIEGVFVQVWQDTLEVDGRPATGTFRVAIDFEDPAPCAATSDLTITDRWFSNRTNLSSSHLNQGITFLDTGTIQVRRSHFDRDSFEGSRTVLRGESQHSTVTFSTAESRGRFWISFSGIYKPEEDVITGIINCTPARPVCDGVLLELEATSDPPFEINP